MAVANIETTATPERGDIMKTILTAIVVALASGCSYSAPVSVSVSHSVYSNYDGKIPGTYGLYVDAEKAKQIIILRQLDYPVDAREAFEQSVYITFENLLEGIKKVDNPVSATDIRSHGLDGMIRIEIEEFESEIAPIGAYIDELEAETEITTSIRVVGHEGNLLGANVEVSADHRHGGGGFGEGGSVAVSKSVEDAIKKTMTQLGQLLTNSVKIREAAPKL